MAMTTDGFAQRRLVLIDADSAGPGGTHQMSMMAFLRSPQVDVLGITIATGDDWRDEEVQQTLRMLEQIERTETGSARGSFPLVRIQEDTRLTTHLIGNSMRRTGPDWESSDGIMRIGSQSSIRYHVNTADGHPPRF